MNSRRTFFDSFCFYYLPVILWMGIIFYLSSVPGLKTGVQSVGLEFFLRKNAHLIEYFILAILFFRIFYQHLKLSFIKSARYCFFATVVYAISDEIHQVFVEERAGRLIDVFFDAIGSLLGIGFVYFISKIKKE